MRVKQAHYIRTNKDTLLVSLNIKSGKQGIHVKFFPMLTTAGLTTATTLKHYSHVRKN